VRYLGNALSPHQERGGPDRPELPSHIPTSIATQETPRNDPPETLRTAAIIIVTKGWCRHAVSGLNGEVCLGQAIREACNGNHVDAKTALSHLASFLQVADPVEWQDGPNQTETHVISALLEAAA